MRKKKSSRIFILAIWMTIAFVLFNFEMGSCSVTGMLFGFSAGWAWNKPSMEAIYRLLENEIVPRWIRIRNLNWSAVWQLYQHCDTHTHIYINTHIAYTWTSRAFSRISREMVIYAHVYSLGMATQFDSCRIYRNKNKSSFLEN